MPVLINLPSDEESDAEEERSNPANDDADDEAARASDDKTAREMLLGFTLKRLAEQPYPAWFKKRAGRADELFTADPELQRLMHESKLHADATQPAAIASTTAPVESAAPRRLRQSTVKDSPNYSDDWRDQPLPGDEELGERVSSREAPPKLSRRRAAAGGARKCRRSGV